jgi:signal peptidase II
MAGQTVEPVRSATEDEPATNQVGHRLRPTLIFCAIAGLMLTTDLLTKSLAWQRVPDEGTEIIPLLLRLQKVTNTGAVFGVAQGAQWLFTTISVIAIAVIVHVFWRSPRGAWPLHGCLALILAGAVGNLYDRIAFSYVRDFLYLFPGLKLPFGLTWLNGDDRLYPWIFNVADVCLVVGVSVLLLMVWAKERRGKRQPPGA